MLPPNTYTATHITEDNKQYLTKNIAKIMSDVFIVDLFYFQINKNITIFASSNQHLTGMPEYIKHMILNTLQVFYI